MNVRLTPPWFTLRNQLFHTIGMSPHVDISPLNTIGPGVYEITICVYHNPDIALAIRAVVPTSYHFGNITVKTTVLDLNKSVVSIEPSKCYTPKEIGNIFCCAFQDNPILLGFVLTEKITSSAQQLSIGKITMVASQHIVQFFNEDITNFCQNYIEIAANVLSEILNNCYNPNIKVSFTTDDPDNELLKKHILKCR